MIFNKVTQLVPESGTLCFYQKSFISYSLRKKKKKKVQRFGSLKHLMYIWTIWYFQTVSIYTNSFYKNTHFFIPNSWFHNRDINLDRRSKLYLPQRSAKCLQNQRCVKPVVFAFAFLQLLLPSQLPLRGAFADLLSAHCWWSPSTSSPPQLSLLSLWISVLRPSSVSASWRSCERISSCIVARKQKNEWTQMPTNK